MAFYATPGVGYPILCQHLGNPILEHFFMQLWSSNNDSAPLALSHVFGGLSQRLDLSLISNLSHFTIDALDNLLSEGVVIVESEDMLLRQIVELGSDYFPLIRHIRFEFLSKGEISKFAKQYRRLIPSESIWLTACYFLVPHLPSCIFSPFPRVFEQFRWYKSRLLWRGSRDGFEAKVFHERCDFHPNTLTLIRDTKGNIFGGFTIKNER
jgi:hypothetical protein